MIPLLATFLACALTTPPPTDAPVQRSGPTPVSSATYTWSWAPAPADVTPRADGGWVFTTDLGYTVELHEGQLVAYSAWLEPCPTHEVGWIDLFVAPAYAGHSVMSNPAASRRPLVEDLTALPTQTLPPVSFDPTHVCDVGALFARGDRHTRPDGHDMMGTSITLKGVWKKGEQTQPFDLSTTIAHSAGTELNASGTGTHLEVEVRRSLDGLFDGIDLATTPEPRVLRGVLANLVDHTTFVARRTDD